MLLSGCSAKKNTAGRRFWQAFVTRFNVYHNGSEAYKEGIQAQTKGNRDNYTDFIPLYPIGNESSWTLGSSNFETAITKSQKAIQLHSIKKKPAQKAGKKKSAKEKAWLSRQEYNPFLKNAWLLMGKAQFQQGKFIEAASTFSYITRHYAAEPLVANEARAWMARSYAAIDWFYDAEDALDRLRRDSINSRVRKATDVTKAELLLRQERFEEALPLVRRVAKAERNKTLKARMYFLIGQMEQHLGNGNAAQAAYKVCLRQSPPYELAFNARIRQTEVLSAGGAAKKMIKRLKRMAKSENNKDYLDQVFYALGNIHLAQGDTALAIKAYEEGRAKSQRGGIEKGVLVLRLGELYWQLGRYDKAQPCYAEAVGSLNKEHEKYENVKHRSKVLDELVPFTSAVFLQDSLQALVRMPEAERLAVIDKAIEDLKKREAEERRAKRDSAIQAQNGDAGGGNAGGMGQGAAPTVQTGDGSWYFYNPMIVIKGKQDFAKRWGKRKNEDDWRRSDKSVVALASDEGVDYEMLDSLEAAQALADSLALAADTLAVDSAQNDPHTREYYLAQLPFSEEALAASDAIIMDGLHNAGVIEKDKLEDFPLAEKTFRRLYTQYPDYEKMDEVFYELFLLYSRWQRQGEAEAFRQRMAEEFPSSILTRRICDPDYERLARYGREIEDSLYTATYDAYRRRDNGQVAENFSISSERFPTGANRPKFIFVHALSRLGTAEPDTIASELRALVKDFPKSDVAEMAGMIVKGIESGREIGTGTYDLGSIWTRRSASADEVSADVAGRELTAERMADFVCVIAYPTDSIDDNKLLYNLAHFNFTSFMYRNFDIQLLREASLTQYRIAGFGNYDEAHTYSQRLYADSALHDMLSPARILVISRENLELLGVSFSFDDYDRFYEEQFAPMEIDPELPIELEHEPTEIRYEDELTPEELEQLENLEKQVESEGSEDVGGDDGEWYDI